MNLRERICEQGRCCPGTVGYPANADPTICIEHAIDNLRPTEQTHRQQMQHPGIIIILVMSMPKTCVQFVGSLFSGSKKRLNTDQQFSFPLIIIELWKWWDDQWPLGEVGHQGVPKEFHVYTEEQSGHSGNLRGKHLQNVQHKHFLPLLLYSSSYSWGDFKRWSLNLWWTS